MSLFNGATEQQIRTILRYSSQDLYNEENCAFILSSIGTCFGVYYNQLMDLSFDDFSYIDKSNDIDYINLFTNKLYKISNFEYRFYSNLHFGSKLEYQMYIQGCEF
jgi:hypothetical protein